MKTIIVGIILYRILTPSVMKRLWEFLSGGGGTSLEESMEYARSLDKRRRPAIKTADVNMNDILDPDWMSKGRRAA